MEISFADAPTENLSAIKPDYFNNSTARGGIQDKIMFNFPELSGIMHT